MPDLRDSAAGGPRNHAVGPNAPAHPGRGTVDEIDISPTALLAEIERSGASSRRRPRRPTSTSPAFSASAPSSELPPPDHRGARGDAGLAGDDLMRKVLGSPTTSTGPSTTARRSSPRTRGRGNRRDRPQAARAPRKRRRQTDRGRCASPSTPASTKRSSRSRHRPGRWRDRRRVQRGYSFATESFDRPSSPSPPPRSRSRVRRRRPNYNTFTNRTQRTN